MLTYLEPITRALGLFPSVIKSGEDWTGTCQDTLNNANDSVKSIRQILEARDADRPTKLARVAAKLEEWDNTDPPNAHTGHSYSDIAESILEAIGE